MEGFPCVVERKERAVGRCELAYRFMHEPDNVKVAFKASQPLVLGIVMEAIIDALKGALVDMDKDKWRKAMKWLERTEELYYDGRTVVDNYDAFFMALGVVLLYAIPVEPYNVERLASALGVDLKGLGASLDHFAWFPG